MVKLGFYITLEAKPGKNAELQDYLRHALSVVNEEAGAIAWFAARRSPTSYVVFDVFPDQESRKAHYEAGRLGLEQIGDLFAEPPAIVEVDVAMAGMRPLV